MSEQNKALVRRYNDEFWGKGDESLLEELFAENLVDTTQRVPISHPAAKA